MKNSNSIQSKVMKKAWLYFKRDGIRTMEAWSDCLKRAWKFIKFQEEFNRIDFDAAEFLQENRNWIIEDIIELHGRHLLVTVMNAVKEAVEECICDNEAFHVVDDVIKLHNFDVREVEEANMRRVRERARYVLG